MKQKIICLTILACILFIGIVILKRDRPKTFPPTNAELTTPGSGKFVIFTRESISDKEWHYSANAWEFDPNHQPLQLTRRNTFKQSDWNPYILSDNPDLRSAGLVRLQAADAPLGDHVTVDLYDIDYRTWKVNQIMNRKKLNYVGEEGNNFYMRTNRGIEIINLATREVRLRKQPFQLHLDAGTRWLISKGEGDAQKYFLFDPATDQELKELPLKNYPQFYNSALSPDKRYLAQTAPISWEALKNRQNEAGVEWTYHVSLESNLHILDLETLDSFISPIRRYATVGSGAPVMPTSANLNFIDNTTLWYQTGKHENHALPRLELFDNRRKYLRSESLNLSTRKVTKATTEPKIEPKPWPTFPSYLQSDSEYPHAEHALVHAFLKFHGITYPIPNAWNQTTVAYSNDRKTFLAKLHTGPEDVDYFYGNLETKKLERIHPPTTALAQANAIEISFIITPDDK